MTPARCRWPLLAVLLLAGAAPLGAQPLFSSPPLDSLGDTAWERSGLHDANNIRTVFWNYGMVGDYPKDPLRVDLTTFHSAEAPKGSGMNYTDGITPFVLAKIRTLDDEDAYIMETGYRERQAQRPGDIRDMRFEPRPGYFQTDADRNPALSPAISSDPRTWPDLWADQMADTSDPGWPGKWNGYFGQRRVADQESYMVMDDQYYEAWNYFPDANDPERRGLGLRVGVRGFQWSNPQAGNVIFWHYDITNEGTVDYDDNIIFGLYMDSGVGGSALSCDGIAESDDDNAYWDRSRSLLTGSRLNLVYTWDKNGHGVDLSGPCGRTGYLGYAYLETPGNHFDGIDNDDDGITDERRDGGPGQLIEGQAAISAYVAAFYDTAKFRAAYGPLESRPAYKLGRWWTGDEDMDWNPEFDDVGADGLPASGDTLRGEGNGIPSEGEPDFDRTDLNESDQIGLTGFKMNRIRPPDDNIVFFTNQDNWPQRLYQRFTDSNPSVRFDSALVQNYNIGFLFASGPFKLKAGTTERFSLALAYGADLDELETTIGVVQLIYNSNYQFAVPPPTPTLHAEVGDGYVRLSWDDAAERARDPVSNEFDFEGYKIYRATDPDFRDVKVLTTGRGNASTLNGKPIAQFDLADGKKGYSRKAIDGVQYYLGQDNGIVHTWIDTTVTNGQEYYYAVTAYDYGYDPGPDSLRIFPSENSMQVNRSLRGGLILPSNVVVVRPNPKALGYERASTTVPAHVLGHGAGAVEVRVVDSGQVPDGHAYKIAFSALSPDSLHASSYALVDTTAEPDTVLISRGTDFDGAGVGAVGGGLLPVVRTQAEVKVDSADYVRTSGTNTRLKVSYQPVLSKNLRRRGYPENFSVFFGDDSLDTGLAIYPVPAKLAKFRVVAHTDTGDTRLRFTFRDLDNDGKLSGVNERIDVVSYANDAPTVPQVTWRVELDTLGQGARGPIQPPRLGDTLDVTLSQPFGARDLFVFTGTGQKVDRALALQEPLVPYVVPNPYIEAASFEPARFALSSGRGDRRIEFRGLPQGCTVRIYTVRGDLVRTLRHDGSDNGYVAWDMRTKDNLDVAPGLYIFHVETPARRPFIGKFAIIK